MKPVRLRPLAEVDLVERTRHYRGVGGDALAGRFFDAAIVALRAVAEMPGIGSPRIGDLVDVPGLRRIAGKGFASSWFYVDRHGELDVVRLLADRQDLQRLLDDVDEA